MGRELLLVLMLAAASPAFGLDIGAAQDPVLARIRLDRLEGHGTCQPASAQACAAMGGDTYDKYRATLIQAYAGTMPQKSFTARIRTAAPPADKVLYVLIVPGQAAPKGYAFPKGEKNVLIDLWSEAAYGFCVPVPEASAFSDGKIAKAIAALRRDHPCKTH